ncbi:hypothetical protein D3P08_03795 [Paenibacillus nanensis]|uniref:Uncharacterized protein n=1 Tax=Paenibacillus nanensis TaxID=393251 RepID=A0A3A1VEE9_9BACL|nr:hypothetical protein [Paenibacillus nanensis]RIX59288.1 hypothetical protein D3P08_03795 [Paenibacillus nanensis]
MKYAKKERGWYTISNDLSGIEICNVIVEIIRNETGAPIRFDVGEGSEGRADVIGMYLPQQCGIQVDFNLNPITKELSVFYLHNQNISR